MSTFCIVSARHARVRPSLLHAALVAVGLALPMQARTADATWIVGGFNYMSQASNWSGNAVPDNFSNLYFNGFARPYYSPVVADLDQASHVFGSITFNPGFTQFYIGSGNTNQLRITSGIDNRSSVAQQLWRVLIEASQTWDGGQAGLSMDLINFAVHPASAGAPPSPAMELSIRNKVAIESLILSKKGVVTLQPGATLTTYRTRLDDATLNISGGAQLIEKQHLPSDREYIPGDVDWIGYSRAGKVDISGAGSSWVTSKALYVGRYSAGTLIIRDGGRLVSGAAGVMQYIGSGAGGTVTLSGADTSWTANGNLAFGDSQGDLLEVRDGARLDISQNFSVGKKGTVNVSGGSLSAGSLSLSGGTFVVDDDRHVAAPNLTWSAGTIQITGNGGAKLGAGMLAANLSLNSPKKLMVDKVLTIDAGTSLALNDGWLSVGTLALNGGTVTAGDGTFLGTLDWSAGTLNVTGAGGFNAGGFSLGAGSLTGTIKLDAGKNLNLSSGLTVGSGAALILNGGGFNAASLNLNGGSFTADDSHAPQNFTWNAGTLQITGNGGARLGVGLLANERFALFGPNRNLVVDKTLTVGGGSVLIANGSGWKAGTLALDGGLVSGTLNFNDIGKLQGYGSVLSSVRGGADKSIVAGGGTLVLGDANLNDGYAFDGTLDVGNARVVLLNKGAAQMSPNTTLGAGGVLESGSGFVMAGGHRLVSNGRATIVGDFRNNGQIDSQSGVLTFRDDVSGTGAFSGALSFHAGYNPGDAGNPTAAIDFGGGSVRFDANSYLTLDLNGTAPGAYDQLGNLGALRIDGTLHLVFGAGFNALPGASFKLFGVGTTGSLIGPERIVVDGYDRNRLDFSHLNQDGTLSISAVPELNSYAMLLAGLGILGGVMRRRRIQA